MSKAVEQRRGQLLVAEDLDPLGEREVGGDDRRAAFVAVGEQVDEQFAAGPLEGHEAEFVDDQQGDTQAALMQTSKRAFIARLDHFGHEVGGTDQGDPLPALDGFDAERDREVGLDRLDRTGDHHVLAAFEVLTGGKSSELRSLDPAQDIPVE